MTLLLRKRIARAPTRRRVGCGCVVCVLALTAGAATGCKFKPTHNMEEQPGGHGVYNSSVAFSDGTTARSIPPGTVPRPAGDSPGFAYAGVRQTVPAMTDSDADSDVVPFPITREILLRGQQRFDIFCSECHGRLGDGDGMIVRRGLTPPPSFHIDRIRQVSDGHIYNVIGNGYGQMFSYNDRVLPEDRWMIVAYIRALQASTEGARMAGLSAQDRQKLEGIRP